MNKSEVNCVQDPLTMAEEIDRLARLCEAKDAEIKHIIADGLRLMEGQQILQQQFYEAQAQIAMQAEALNIPYWMIEMIGGGTPIWFDGRHFVTDANKAIHFPTKYSAECLLKHLHWEKYECFKLGWSCYAVTEHISILPSSETVAAFRAKEAEPLRREVAMMSEALRDFATNFDCDEDAHKYGTTCRSCESKRIHSDTQATALAYEREVKAKVLNELFSVFSPRGTDGTFCIEAKELEEYIEELRAANKGEVK